MSSVGFQEATDATEMSFGNIFIGLNSRLLWLGSAFPKPMVSLLCPACYICLWIVGPATLCSRWHLVQEVG